MALSDERVRLSADDGMLRNVTLPADAEAFTEFDITSEDNANNARAYLTKVVIVNTGDTSKVEVAYSSEAADTETNEIPANYGARTLYFDPEKQVTRFFLRCASAHKIDLTISYDIHPMGR